MGEGKLHQLQTKYLFRNYLIELSNVKVSEINLNPIVIYDAMVIMPSVLYENIGESLFQTLVKASRLQEEEETILVFDNYSDNQEYFLKTVRKNKSSH